MAGPDSSRRRPPGSAVAVVAAVLAMVVAATPSSAATAKPKHHKKRIAHIQLLAINDFHGALETGGKLTTSYQHNADGSPRLDSLGRPVPNTVEAGGAAYLAANLAKARKGHKYTITAAAGDLVGGASPMISSAFHDEPAIDALDDLGLAVSSVGNHEFDEGASQLLRMKRGGCLADGTGVAYQDSCPSGHTYRGSTFRYLAANVVTPTGSTLFPSYWIKHFGHGIKIAFIGMTLKGTPSMVPPSGIVGLQFRDEVATANRLVPEIKKQGVKSIVVLLHQGGYPDYRVSTTTPSKAPPPYDFRCNSKQGLTPDSEIVAITKLLNPAIDLVVSGHTHQPYVCNVRDQLGRSRLVTSASSYGRAFTDIRLAYNQRTGDIVRSQVTATNRIVKRTIKPDARVAALVRQYKALLAPISSRVVGTVAVPLPNTANSAGEMQLGDLVADSLANNPTAAVAGTPDVAFMNRRGIRAGLNHAGNVSFGRAYIVKPPSTSLVSMSMTGQQVIALLNQQWSGPNAGSHRKMLQVSDGFSYRWQATPAGPVLDETSVQINGAPLVRAQTYRVVANDYLAAGGDGFAAFTSATNKIVGSLDLDAFVAYLQSYTTDVGPWAPPTAPRISTY